MPRALTKFVCASCGYQSPRWYGRCPQCGEWNSLAEESGQPSVGKISRARPVVLAQVEGKAAARFSSGMSEFDRVLGGGIVPGSVTLIGGEPGIGKSTLLLSVADNVASGSQMVLYVSGEESQNQVKMRAERLNLRSTGLYFAAEQDVGNIIHMCEGVRPRLLIVDSIQTCQDASAESLAGSPTQVRACAAKLHEYAKVNQVAVFLVGHTVKTGGIAGPRLLEHLVDTVLYFEGDANHLYRIVRAQKNRFGPTNETAVFQMTTGGLREVKNPSELFLSEAQVQNAGCCAAVALKGNQPICVEVQALVSTPVYGSPRRVTSEIDSQRASLILAVLSKWLAAGLDARDAFLKIAGGIRVTEPGIDLACGLALMSSYHGAPVRKGLICFGEIGLSGEIRMVARMEERVGEAVRTGFKGILVPEPFLKRYPRGGNIIGVSTIEDAVRNALLADVSKERTTKN